MDLTKEQMEKVAVVIQEHIKKQTKQSMIEYDKTLSAVVDKLEACGWTLPTELGIYAVNVIGNTDEITNIDKFLLWYFTENEYEHFNNMLNSILEAPIEDGLKKVVDECRFAFENKKFAICVNCTPFVRQYDILSNRWGDLLCCEENRTNGTRRNSRSWSWKP